MGLRKKEYTLKNIPVIKSSMPPLEEYTREIADLWENRWLTNHGNKVAKLEEETAKLLGSEYSLAYVNGHQAIEAALRVFRFPEGGEVITTPFTFVSTTAAIVRCGLTPVFCDINESDFTMDPECLEALITEKTCAILPVHVYSNICAFEKIQEIADRYGLKVIYDAAHAFGAEKDGIKVGAMGDLTVLSMHATKAFHSIEGGLICFHDLDLVNSLWEEQNFGISAPDSVFRVAPNAKMNEFQAAMGLCNLKHFSEYVESRKENYLRYAEKLHCIPGIRINEIPDSLKSNYAYFPIVVDPDVFGVNRNRLAEHLNARGIGTRKYFWPLTCDFECYRGYKKQPVSIAEHIAEQILTLPMYSDLSIEEVDYICDAIETCSK